MVRSGDGVKAEQVSRRRRLVPVDPRDVREQGVERNRGLCAPDFTANVVPPIIVTPSTDKERRAKTARRGHDTCA
jgi:hypothetical protein